MKKKIYVSEMDLIKEWDFVKNFNLDPRKISSGSDIKAWWKCSEGHEWVSNVKNRTYGRGCPTCAGRRVCKDNCLATLRPDLAAQWHPTKNGDLTPNDVTISSGKKVWWKCDKGDDHEWEAIIADRSKFKGYCCPCCSGKKVCKDNCLATLRPEIAAQWHPTRNGSLTPNDVTCGNHRKVWWKCDKGDDHEWESTINNRTKPSGNNCPCCSGHKVCKSNCLATLNIALSKEWHPTKNGTLTPNDVTCWCDKKVWWVCKNGHEWKALISSRSAGNCCARCSNIISKISQEWLDTYNIEQNFREIQINLKGRKYIVDGFDSKTNTVYEFLGDYWHGNPEIFSPGEMNPTNKKSFGQLFEETKTRISRLEQAGYKVVHIWERDFLSSQP